MIKEFFGKLSKKFWPFSRPDSDEDDSRFEGQDIERIIADLESSYVKGRQNQSVYRRRWRVIDDFLLGYQGDEDELGPGTSMASDNPDRQVGNGDNDINEEVYVNNKMLEAHREDMARYTRYHPNISVAPNNPNNEKDKRGARMSKIVLQDILRKNKFETRIKIRGARIVTTKGCVSLKVTFDPTAGAEAMLPEHEKDAAGENVLDEDGEPLLRTDAEGEPIMKEGNVGEVIWDMVSPRNLTFPKGCVDLASAPWIQETNIRSVAWVRERYGVDVKGENISEEESYYFPTREEGASSGTADKDSANVLVKERWYRPCKKFPKGAILVWASKKRLRFTTLKPFYPDIPYFWANNILNENYILGDTPYFHVIADQFMLNRVDSKTMRYMDVWGNIKLLVHVNSEIEEEDISNEDDQVLEWDGDHPPSYAKPPDLPITLLNFRNQILDNIRSKVAIRDRARKAASGNVIAYEQDQDDSTISPCMQEMEQMFQDGAQFSLRLVSENYDVPRIIRMTGQTKKVIEDFTGDMLEGNFSAEISLMNGLPSNKYARQQYLLTMFKLQALTKEQLLRYSEFPDIERVFEEFNKEAENIEDFLEALGKGEAQPVMPWMNLALLENKLKLYLGEKYFYMEKPIQEMAMQTYMDVEARLMKQNMAKMQAMAPGDMAPQMGQDIPWMPQEAGGATSSQSDGGQPGADARPEMGPGSFMGG